LVARVQSLAISQLSSGASLHSQISHPSGFRAKPYMQSILHVTGVHVVPESPGLLSGVASGAASPALPSAAASVPGVVLSVQPTMTAMQVNKTRIRKPADMRTSEAV